MGHDTPVSDQVSDNGTEHSGISVPGPGRLATGKIIKRRPSEVLRDEEVTGTVAAISDQLSNHLTRIKVGGKHVVNQPETTPTPSPSCPTDVTRD